MHSSPPEIMRCALDQRDLWHAALSLQLRTPAGRAVPHDGNTPAWPGALQILLLMLILARWKQCGSQGVRFLQLHLCGFSEV